MSGSRSGRGRDSCRDDGSDWDFQLDTERIVARDYGSPVGLENPAGALLHPVWFCAVVGVVWLLDDNLCILINKKSICKELFFSYGLQMHISIKWMNQTHEHVLFMKM